MVGERLLEVRHLANQGIYLRTSGATYFGQIFACVRVDKVRSAAKDGALPASFRGLEVVKVRWDGHDLCVQLVGDRFISYGWLPDTRTGEGFLALLYHEGADINAEFLDWWNGLDANGQRLDGM